MRLCAPPPIYFWIAEQFFMKLGAYITFEPISTAYFLNPSPQFVCLYVYAAIVASQRFGKNIPTATNTHAIELLDWSFSMKSVSYERKVDD
jgi:hypothetical protein